jgi:pectate lyase
MKRIAISAALALALVLVLVVSVGGVAQADCFATNCAISEQQWAATPAQGAAGTEGGKP